MSVQSEIRRLTAPDIRARKGGEPIVVLTSYHAHTAALADKHCDVILVGDSLGMVMHGLETHRTGHARHDDPAGPRGDARLEARAGRDRPAVRLLRGLAASRPSCRAARVLKETGCGAIKLEGGRRMAETIAFLIERGVPVMAHVGLTPQAINALGSFRAQGRDEADWARDRGRRARRRRGGRLFGGARGDGRTARAPRSPARSQSRPSASARAWPATARSWCSRTCSACRRGCRNSSSAMATSAPAIDKAIADYAAEVRARAFPGPEHTYPMRKK